MELKFAKTSEKHDCQLYCFVEVRIIAYGVCSNAPVQSEATDPGCSKSSIDGVRGCDQRTNPLRCGRLCTTEKAKNKLQKTKVMACVCFSR